MAVSEQDLIDLLKREMRDHKDFVRIHAAEALAEQGYGNDVADEMHADVESPVIGYRIGVWRVMATIASDEKERAKYEERVRAVLRDPTAADRVHAIETLAKLEAGSREDRPLLEEWLTHAE